MEPKATQKEQVPVADDKPVTAEELDAAFQAALQSGEEEGKQIEEIPSAPPEPLNEEKSAEEVKEPEASDEPVKEEKPAIPEDHSERSHLGRKMKGLEAKIEAILSKLDAPKSAAKEKEETIDVEDEDEEVVTTSKDVKKILERYEAERIKKEQQKKLEDEKKNKEYEEGYLDTLEDFKQDPNYAEISKIMIDKYNFRITGNPVEDAQTNFDRATAAFYRQASKKPTIPIRGGKPSVPLGVDVPTQKEIQTKPKVKFDPIAAEYLERIGVDEDKAQDWLK